MIYFLHIPKTAGSTIRSILAQNFPRHMRLVDKEAIKISKIELDKIKLISGHFSYGIHEILSKPGSYFTMLRHPIDRFFSEYHYIKDRWQHDPGMRNNWMQYPTFHIFSKENLSIEYFVDNCPNYMDNIIIRKILGYIPENRRVNNVDLETAKIYLKENIDIFGISERFNESILLIARRYNFLCPVYIVKNVGIEKKISSIVREKVAEKQRYDIELYKWAVNRFNEIVDSQEDLFRSALVEFEATVKELNNNYDRQKNISFGVMSSPDAIALEAGRQCKIVQQYLQQNA